MRKMISFKIENLSDKERQIVDQWADGQANIQQSLANIVMHVVSIVGNADVMDFDIQRKLHTMFANSDSNNSVSDIQKEIEVETIYTEPIEPTAKKTDTEGVYTTAADLFNND